MDASAEHRHPSTAAQGGASLYLKTQAQTCPILDLPEVVIGRCGHAFRGEVEENKPDVLFPDAIIRGRFAETIPPEFACEVIQTPLGRSHFQSNARTAVGIWKIGAEDIRSFPIPVPPLEVQREIVDMVNRQRALIAEERKAAEERRARATREVEEMILGVRPVG